MSWRSPSCTIDSVDGIREDRGRKDWRICSPLETEPPQGERYESIPLGEELALAAGRLLLSHPDVPIADALIASLVKIEEAEYVITDDPHYQDMKVRTKWV